MPGRGDVGCSFSRTSVIAEDALDLAAEGGISSGT